MEKKQIISPISIDLGAKNTGVYFAHYEVGSSIENIEKEGKVYQLERDSYTLLMANRTARRHQRRGYDRRQMVKRLFKLIWEKHFGLEWDKDVQQTTSFLFNRRGFSFLAEEYNQDILADFPEDAHQVLPEKLQIDANDRGKYDFDSALTEWANEGEEKTKSMFDAINIEPERIRNRLVFISKTKKLKEYCDKRRGGNEIQPENKKSLETLSSWVWDEWQRSGVRGLDETFVAKDQNNGSEIEWKKPTSFNLVMYLNRQSREVASQILNSLPDTSSEKELKASIWNFKGEDFKLEEKDFTPPDSPKENATKREKDDYQKTVIEWKRLHLQHLTFALHKTLIELQSGSRHRSKYFEEIKGVLKCTSHTHSYLETFCKKLHDKVFKPAGYSEPLSDDSLTYLIGHLSNLELKPLRKYFNDEKHKTGDYWDEKRLTKKFERWIISEWRINLEKDKDKDVDKEGDYKKLCKDWKVWKESNPGKLIDFWLKTDPFFTIPPYQDNNNRRPPRCQSLILNPVYMDSHYPAWQTWLAELKKLEAVQEHLTNYEKELKDLKSGKGGSYFSDNVEGKRKTQSGRRTSYDLDARILQFIFDRVKADDPLNLNEIYSHAKKYRQSKKEDAKSRLEEAIRHRELPETLKTPRDYQNDALFEQGSFLHLACKYYKIRQKARDGRVFIHPECRYVKERGYENTGRFDDKGHLLTYCNHKPRQKRYQMLGDLAGLLQIAPVKLSAFVEGQNGDTIDVDEKLFNWLNGIDNLKANCERATTEQKERRGRLKLDIQKIFGLIYHRRQSKSPFKKEIKDILTASKVDEADKLYRFCERAKNLCLTVTQSLYDASKQQQWQRDLEDNPAAAVYLLAQINNLAFKERSGNTNTCAVCSTDNAQRMQMITSESIKESHAKAQRLPAIETRLIDGAVMRMARIVGGAIADDKWEKIKGELQLGKHVRIPIITESNHFEFEPSREELVKNQRTTPRTGKALTRRDERQIFAEKDTRIRNDGVNICPYTGTELTNAGERDHIIPRQSEWGTLNDEANLIWASHIGNHHKTNVPVQLGDLDNNYKSAQFPDMDDATICEWIKGEIGNGEEENFTFGPYRSFINLTTNQRKAFRHALFLANDDPLRKRVIDAIDNRNRTLVNGTQRYFAEVLADSLHKKAIQERLNPNLLSFDYFAVSSDADSSKVSVPVIRRYFEQKTDDSEKNLIHPELRDHQKGNKTQSDYSHLVDATTAFMIALSEHYKDGSLKIKTPYISPYDYSDDNGELKDLYAELKIDCRDFKSRDGYKKLKRRKPEKDFFIHKTLFDSNAGAWHFLKLIEIETAGEKHYLKGFLELGTLKSCLRKEDWKKAINEEYGLEVEDDANSQLKLLKFGSLLTGVEKNRLPYLYQIGKDVHQFGYQNKERQWPKAIIENHRLGKNSFTVRLYQLDKTKVAQFLHKQFNTRSNPYTWQEVNCQRFLQLEKLWYFTKRKKLTGAPSANSAQQPDFSCKCDDIKARGFLNPSLFKAWDDLKDKWDKYKREHGESNHNGFLKGHFLKTIKQEKSDGQSRSHERTRKEFSLPVSAKGQGFMLIARKTWNKDTIYQCQAEKSGESGAGLYKKRINAEGKTYDSLTPYFRSRNIVLLKKLEDIRTSLSQEGEPIGEDKWYKLKVPSGDEFKNIKSMENQYQSKGVSIWRITFETNPTMKDLIDLMYGGYHIDELKVGSNPKDKKEIKRKAERFFQNSDGFMNIEEAKETLQQKQEAINKKYQGNRQSKTDKDRKFIKRWLQCLDALEGTILQYKRGVSLQIES